MNPAAQNPLAQANNAANSRAEEVQARRQEQAAQEPQAGGETRASQANQANQLRESEQAERTNDNDNIERDRQAQSDDREAANLAADQNAYSANPASALTASRVMGTILDMKA
jgi:hypothetical protein